MPLMQSETIVVTVTCAYCLKVVRRQLSRCGGDTLFVVCCLWDCKNVGAELRT